MGRTWIVFDPVKKKEHNWLEQLGPAPDAHAVISTGLKRSWDFATRATTWEEWKEIENRQAKGKRRKRLPCVQTQNPHGFSRNPMRPLLPDHIRALVNTFCDPSIREPMLNNPDLYKDLRLYVRFGEVSPPGEAKSTELSRPVYFDQLLKGIRSEMRTRAIQMGVALAIIHCNCKYDAAGVKFQLALHPKKRKVMLWPTNFEHCKTFKSSSENIDLKLALAIAKNPTWPRPPGMFGFLKRDSRLAPEARETCFLQLK
ncbi:hypothetical protein EDB82DRAFT_123980 [Fusarium venenatum]|uniref:uncharacterized protein n=1 Tax=Fusarium venenatum TaxID=56646 RepID=UPI001DC5E984|nr:hypothetical protein EDB82DRAFT_123980 [Fusarium venenatum]